MSTKDLRSKHSRTWRPVLNTSIHYLYLDEPIMNKYAIDVGEVEKHYRWDSISKFKKKGGQYLLPFNNYSAVYRFLRKLSKNQYLEVGHIGTSSIASARAKASEYGTPKLQKKMFSNVEKHKKAVFATVEEHFPGMKTTYLKSLSTKMLKGSLEGVLVMPQNFELNQESIKALETELGKSTEKLRDEIFNLKGSKSYKQHLDYIIYNAYKHGKQPKAFTEKATTITKPKKKKRKIVLPREKGETASQMSTSSLFNIINAQLNEQVAGLMGDPYLNYRTGRFANSVEVNRVTRGRKGMLTFYYTYMKYPYQTFEPGFRQGHLGKDPRLLISASIRSIAEGLVKERFRSVRE